ncbi:MAG TPA: hypothetical protein VKB01_05210 [Thermomicrobiales bacterium]|jgi:hypothetical protein|nr:hypothetical protein [Thermomicrobiales bacterium]
MLRGLAPDPGVAAGDGMRHQARRSECFVHGGEVREPWRSAFRDIEVVRCDHLGVAYVVEMVLVAGSPGSLYRSHHIHFVRDGRREVHALADELSQDVIDGVWSRAVLAMERGEAPDCHRAHFHHRPSR